jgi:serine/threonine protein kinase
MQRHSRSSSDLAGLDEVMSQPSTEAPGAFGKMWSGDDTRTFEATPIPARNEDGVLICPFDVDLVEDARGRNQLFGHGAWSNVYKATPLRRAATSQGLLTPPSSPTSPLPLLVAVKKPARPDAKPILRNEATILSYLNDVSRSREYVIPFFGLSDECLVLGACPVSLEDHVRRCAGRASRQLTTTNMHDPVLGSTKSWLRLAHKLVSALTWLHEYAGVVHGDIKPGNFVLESFRSSHQYSFSGNNYSSYADEVAEEDLNPLFIDFSSSHKVSHDQENIPSGTLSAVTREYTAPELLKSSVLRDPSSTATKSSDVFSLAITLLVAATGNTRVYDGDVFRRQAMATQGWQCISFIRSGNDGARIPRFGVVERMVERAVLKDGMGRVSAKDWLDIIEMELGKGDPVKIDKDPHNETKAAKAVKLQMEDDPTCKLLVPTP